MRDRPESRIENRVSSIVGRLTLVLIAAFCMTFELFAAPKVRYRYGESWWYEYEADLETSLLLHFGKPQPKRAKELAKQVEGKRTEKAKEKKVKEKKVGEKKVKEKKMKKRPPDT